MILAEFSPNELQYPISPNYPFVASAPISMPQARACNSDEWPGPKRGNLQYYFDTRTLLGRPVPIIITDKTGRVRRGYWINTKPRASKEKDRCPKSIHPAVGKIYDAIMAAYTDGGRTTAFHIPKWKTALIWQRFMPELFITEFDRMKSLAGDLAAHLIIIVFRAIPSLRELDEASCKALNDFVATSILLSPVCLPDRCHGQNGLFGEADSEYADIYANLIRVMIFRAGNGSRCQCSLASCISWMFTVAFYWQAGDYRLLRRNRCKDNIVGVVSGRHPSLRSCSTRAFAAARSGRGFG